MNFVVKLFILAILTHNAWSFKNPCKKNSEEEFFPHPESDEKYIQCSEWGQMFTFHCPDSLKWNQAKVMCEKESTAKVINLAEVQKPVVRPTFVQLPVTSQSDSVQQPNLASVIGGNMFPSQNAPVDQSAMNFVNQQGTDQSRNTQGQFTFPIQQQPVPAPAVPNLNQLCDKIVIENSQLKVVNGIYTRMTTLPQGEVLPIYKRMDDIRSPGIITQVGDSWCVSFAFSLADFATITPSKVGQQCGADLQCCLLTSDANDGKSLDDQTKIWSAHSTGNVVAVDTSVTLSCANKLSVTKTCVRIPFCPPQCLFTRDECQVCECNGVPFFKNDATGTTNVGSVSQTPAMPQQQQPVMQTPEQVQIAQQVMEVIAPVTQTPVTVTPVVNSQIDTSCPSLRIINSQIPVFKGLYQQIPGSEIFTREDVPAILTRLENVWCLSFLFKTSEFNGLTSAKIAERCKDHIDCCALISDNGSNMDPTTQRPLALGDLNRKWTVTFGTLRDQVDSTLKIACDNLQASAIQTPVAPVQTPVSAFDFITFGQGLCNSVTFSNAQFSFVNGVYGRISSNVAPVRNDFTALPIYRRTDNIKAAAVIVPVSNKWCLSLVFKLEEISTLTTDSVAQRCSSLDCCVMLADINQNINSGDLVDANSRWVINFGDMKNQMDPGLTMQCNDPPRDTSSTNVGRIIAPIFQDGVRLPPSTFHDPRDGFCLTLQITSSEISFINGVYSKMNQSSELLPLYRRSDNINIPGIITTINNNWCITFAFPIIEQATITSERIREVCGLEGKCCLLKSQFVTSNDIIEPTRQWTINFSDKKGQTDRGIKVRCSGSNVFNIFTSEAAQTPSQQNVLQVQQQGSINQAVAQPGNDLTEQLRKQIAAAQSVQTLTPAPTSVLETCRNVTISNSQVPFINGFYMVSPDTDPTSVIYKRSDDSRLPGMIALINNFFCITFAFSNTELATITMPKITQRCGALDCCILVSNNNGPQGLLDANRKWALNIREEKGKLDENINLRCSDGLAQPFRTQEQQTVQPQIQSVSQQQQEQATIAQQQQQQAEALAQQQRTQQQLQQQKQQQQALIAQQQQQQLQQQQQQQQQAAAIAQQQQQQQQPTQTQTIPQQQQAKADLFQQQQQALFAQQQQQQAFLAQQQQQQQAQPQPGQQQQLTPTQQQQQQALIDQQEQQAVIAAQMQQQQQPSIQPVPPPIAPGSFPPTQQQQVQPTQQVTDQSAPQDKGGFVPINTMNNPVAVQTPSTSQQEQDQQQLLQQEILKQQIKNQIRQHQQQLLQQQSKLGQQQPVPQLPDQSVSAQQAIQQGQDQQQINNQIVPQTQQPTGQVVSQQFQQNTAQQNQFNVASQQQPVQQVPVTQTQTTQTQQPSIFEQQQQAAFAQQQQQQALLAQQQTQQPPGVLNPQQPLGSLFQQQSKAILAQQQQQQALQPSQAPPAQLSQAAVFGQQQQQPTQTPQQQAQSDFFQQQQQAAQQQQQAAQQQQQPAQTIQQQQQAKADLFQQQQQALLAQQQQQQQSIANQQQAQQQLSQRPVQVGVLPSMIQQQQAATALFQQQQQQQQESFLSHQQTINPSGLQQQQAATALFEQQQQQATQQPLPQQVPVQQQVAPSQSQQALLQQQQQAIIAQQQQQQAILAQQQAAAQQQAITQQQPQVQPVQPQATPSQSQQSQASLFQQQQQAAFAQQQQQQALLAQQQAAAAQQAVVQQQTQPQQQQQPQVQQQPQSTIIQQQQQQAFIAQQQQQALLAQQTLLVQQAQQKQQAQQAQSNRPAQPATPAQVAPSQTVNIQQQQQQQRPTTQNVISQPTTQTDQFQPQMVSIIPKQQAFNQLQQQIMQNAKPQTPAQPVNNQQQTLQQTLQQQVLLQQQQLQQQRQLMQQQQQRAAQQAPKTNGQQVQTIGTVAQMSPAPQQVVPQINQATRSPVSVPSVNSATQRFNFIPITTCDFVTCGQGMRCEIKCAECNPTCVAAGGRIATNGANRIDCSNINCPLNSVCSLDTVDNNFKCVLRGN